MYSLDCSILPINPRAIEINRVLASECHVKYRMKKQQRMKRRRIEASVDSEATVKLVIYNLFKLIFIASVKLIARLCRSKIIDFTDYFTSHNMTRI